MEQENPTAESGGASTLDRLESFLSTDEPSQQASEPSHPEQDEEEQVDAQNETDDSDKADEQKAESEPPNEYQLSDLAKLLGADESALDVDDDGNILVKTKIDGQEGKAKFSDLLKSYQLQSHVDKQVREAADQRKALQEQSHAFQQQMQVQQAVIGKLAEVKSIEASIAQFQDIDWNALTDADPVQAVKLDRQLRELQQQHYTKSNEIAQAQKQFTQQQTQQQEAMLVNAHQAMLKVMPEWADNAKAKAEGEKITSTLRDIGYTDHELFTRRDESGRILNLGVTDPRFMLLARDAMLYRQQQAAKTVTEKQVRAAPRIIKPGAAQTVNRATQNVQTLKTAVRKSSGSKQSVVDYLLATGKV